MNDSVGVYEFHSFKNPANHFPNQRRIVNECAVAKGGPQAAAIAIFHLNKHVVLVEELRIIWSVAPRTLSDHEV